MKTCKVGHEYDPTSGRGCRQCTKLKSAARYAAIRQDPERLAELRRKAAAYRKERRARDPEWRARLVRHAVASANRRKKRDPAFVESSKDYQRRYHEERSKAPEYLERRRANTRALRADPAYIERERQLAIEADRLRGAVPEFRERKADYMRARFQRAEAKALHRTNSHKRRARLMGSPSPGVTGQQWTAICAKYTRDGETFCAYCKARGAVTIDHVVPIARGGSDEPVNVRPACKRCNSSKRDRLIHEWHRAKALFTDRELVALRKYTERCLASVAKRTCSTSSMGEVRT